MTESQKWMLIIGALAGGWLLYLLAPVITPFAVSAVLAYLGDPVVDRLEAWKLRRTTAVIIVFLVMTLLVIVLFLLVVPMIERQVSVLVSKLPGYVVWIREVALPWLQTHLGIDPGAFNLEKLQAKITEHWTTAGGIAAQILASVTSSGLAIVGFFANLVLIPVVTFYLLRDWDRLMVSIRELIPRQSEKKVVEIAGESDEVLGAFMRGQFLVMIALGIVYSVGLWLAGLELAWLIGMISGLLSFVPYLGFIIGILAAGIAIVMQTQELLPLVYVVTAFGVGQVLESVLLTPYLVGDRIGLHPVTVIFAVLAGGQLFGFVGILLALPVAAVLAVLVRHLRARYVESAVYDRANS